MSYTTTKEIIAQEKKANLLVEIRTLHPNHLLNRCIYENISLTIDEIDDYLDTRPVESQGEERLYIFKKLSQSGLLDAPYHLIKRILK